MRGGSVSTMPGTLLVVDHPLVANQLTQLRSSATDQVAFGRLASEITSRLAYEAFRELPTELVSIDTPVASGAMSLRVTTEVLLIPILRAGLGMIPALQATLPVTRVCAVGLRRNEITLESEVYLDALPASMTGAKVVICDPMLATGGSLVTVADMAVARGADDLTVLTLLSSAPGIERFHASHPEVRVVTAAVDAELNEQGYIVPGLGDAGDRLFGAPVRP